MNDFPELMPWDELSARVKMLTGQNERQQETLEAQSRLIVTQQELLTVLREQIEALEKVVADMMSTIPLPEMEIVAVTELVQDGNNPS